MRNIANKQKTRKKIEDPPKEQDEDEEVLPDTIPLEQVDIDRLTQHLVDIKSLEAQVADFQKKILIAQGGLEFAAAVYSRAVSALGGRYNVPDDGPVYEVDIENWVLRRRLVEEG